MLKKKIELLVNKRKKELEEQKNRLNSSESSSNGFNETLSKANKFGKNVSNAGNLMQKSSNTAMQNFGSKMSNFGNSLQAKTNINGMLNKALSSNAGAASATSAGATAASTAGSTAGTTAGASSSAGSFNPWVAIAMLAIKNIEKTKKMRKENFENAMNNAQNTAENNIEKSKNMINSVKENAQNQLNSDMQSSLTPMPENSTNFAQEQNNENELANSIIDEYKNGLEENVENPVEQTEEQKTASSIFDEFKKGYEENRNTVFSPENLKSSDKSAWNRIGEAFGTTGRFLSKPVVQGAIAGTIYGLDKQNLGAGLKYGYDWAANKARSDMYNKMITGNETAPILNGSLTEKDYTAKADADYKLAKNQLETDKQTFDQQHKTDELNAKKENYQNQWEHWDRQDKINEDKLIYDTLYKNGMLDIAQQNADTNAGKLSETITRNRNTEALARYNAENNAEYRNNVLALRQAELDYEQSKNQGFTPSQKIQQLNKVLDARIKLIDNTDYSVLGFTEQDAELQKKEQKQEVINRYINDMNKLNNQQAANNVPVIESNKQYTEFLPPLPTAPPTKSMTKPITEKKKGWAF